MDRKPLFGMSNADRDAAIALRHRTEGLDLTKPADRKIYDEELKNFIKRNENLPQFPNGHLVRYNDTGTPDGNWTIGTGFNMGPIDPAKDGKNRISAARKEWNKHFIDYNGPGSKPDFDAARSGVRLSQEQIDHLLSMSLSERRIRLQDAYGTTWKKLHANEKLAITDTFFNGETVVNQTSKFHEEIASYYKTGDAIHFDNALWELYRNSNKQRGSNVGAGLQARRTREALVFNTHNRNLDVLQTPAYAIATFRRERLPGALAAASAGLEKLRTGPGAERFVDAAIAEHRRDFAALMRGLGRRPGDVPPAAMAALRSRLLARTRDMLAGMERDFPGMAERVIAAGIKRGDNGAEILRTLEKELALAGDMRGKFLRRAVAGMLDEVAQHANGITRYIWRSRDDEKVRGSHAANDDRVFAWDSPPPTGHPGAEFGCRCWAEPYSGNAVTGTHMDTPQLPHTLADDGADAALPIGIDLDGDGNAGNKSAPMTAIEHRRLMLKTLGQPTPLKPPRPMKALKPLRRPALWFHMGTKARQIWLQNKKAGENLETKH